MIAAACSDAIAPTRSVDESAALTVFTGASQTQAARRSNGGTPTGHFEFVIPAAGGTVQVGEFTLHFPADAVCDPKTSGYGKQAWNRPCRPYGRDLVINATFWSEGGESVIEFSPDIRFNPAVGFVTISTFRAALVNSTDVGDYRIWYWTRGKNGRVRQQDDDPSFTDGSGLVWRILKHFSGISISSG
jgi:hypothetical protein